MNDKNIELKRYDNRAKNFIKTGNYNNTNNMPKYLMPPYDYYRELLSKQDSSSIVLEIGAGMGENTQFLLDLGFDVCASDISPNSVEVMKKRFYEYEKFSAKIADMEKLPFNDESFNIICSAGSLSYSDNAIVINEIYRVLKPGGVIIIVDSLNHNPIYRVNRYIKYLFSARSKSVLKRMPTIDLINKYNIKFEIVQSKYFGSISWAFPFLLLFLSENNSVRLSNYIDKIFNIKKSAFKFVMFSKKKI